MDLGNRRAPNLYRLRYRSGINGRVAEMWLKVPYGTLFSLTDTLTRAMSQGNVLWYRLDVATGKQIAEHRHQLARPTDALRVSSVVTRVDWAA